MKFEFLRKFARILKKNLNFQKINKSTMRNLHYAFANLGLFHADSLSFGGNTISSN